MEKSNTLSRRKTITTRYRTLVLHNDDVNTFDHVIDCLVKYCKHDALQAEQCAHLVHYKGSCDIKRGSYQEMSKLNRLLQGSGLKTSIN